MPRFTHRSKAERLAELNVLKRELEGKMTPSEKREAKEQEEKAYIKMQNQKIIPVQEMVAWANSLDLSYASIIKEQTNIAEEGREHMKAIIKGKGSKDFVAENYEQDPDDE